MIDTQHLHPMLVHFPVALAMVGLLFESVNLFCRKWNLVQAYCGEFILYLASLSALAAVFTGLVFTGNFTGGALAVRDTHELAAFASTILLCAASVVYLFHRFKAKDNGRVRLMGYALYVLSALCIGYTGFLGGSLVYKFMIGL